MAHLDVNPGDLLGVADEYAELQARALAIGPRVVEEVERIIATHGAMGYPAALGIVVGLAREQAAVDMKAAHFGQYSQRFIEHAATYASEDLQAAKTYGALTDTPIDVPISGGGGSRPPVPSGRVRCTESEFGGGFRCSEYFPSGMIYHFLSAVDLTGDWPDWPGA